MKRPAPFTVFVARLAAAKRPEFSGPNDIAADAEEFRSLARRLNAIHTRQCNGYHTRTAETRDERAGKRLESRARLLAAKYEFTLYVQRDPRGLPLYLGYDGHMTDRNYSTTGIAVPL